MKKRIAPSILSADFLHLADDIKAVEAAGADLLHLDVMDGHFVPNITFGPALVKQLRSITSLPLDVHLMIEDPDRYIEEFAKAGATTISVHAEIRGHLDRTIRRIKELGCGAGIALNPATPVEHISYLLPLLDEVVVMTVNPGFGGQRFIDYTLDKFRALKNTLSARQLPAVALMVDGGVTVDNIARISEAGADIFVSGNGIFQTEDYATTIARMKTALAAT